MKLNYGKPTAGITIHATSDKSENAKFIFHVVACIYSKGDNWSNGLLDIFSVLEFNFNNY